MALEWITYQTIPGVVILHILDDFLFIASTYHICLGALQTFQAICKDIGVPLAPEKTMGPSQALDRVFVGF